MPATCCAACGDKVVAKAAPSYRHQVFELPKPSLDITEYQLFHGRCQGCGAASKGALPESAPQGQMGPRLLSHIAILAGQYHLSVRKIQRLLKDQFATHFSTGTISEAQGRVSAMLTPTAQALHQHVRSASMVNVDETTHQRNDEQRTRWLWLMASPDAVYQNIHYSRSQEIAKKVIGTAFTGVVVSDQCASYHWLAPERHQFCWAHIQRNLQKMSDYSGQGLTAELGRKLVLLCHMVFRTQHQLEADTLDKPRWLRRMQRLRRSFLYWLARGSSVPAQKYAGRCQHILKYEKSLWTFLHKKGIPLTNNEAERCLRGAVIMRKICYGTSSDRGDKFRSRLLSVVETCKKRGLSPLDVVTALVSAVLKKQAYPDVFGLAT